MLVREGTALDDLLQGDARNEVFYGFDGADTIFGGAGNDTIEGGLGNDSLSGGEGRDMLSYMEASGGVVVRLHERGTTDGADGYDQHLYGDWPYTLDFEDARGSTFADTLYGSREANLLRGSGGDDLIFGHGGHDTLMGGNGADTLTGGGGALTMTGGLHADLFGVGLFGLYSGNTSLSEVTVITDFSAAEGDRLGLAAVAAPSPPSPPNTYVSETTMTFPRTTYTGYIDGQRGHLPLVFTGDMTPGVPDVGAALPLRELAEVAYLAAWIANPSGGGWLVFDLDATGTISTADRLVRFDTAGPSGIGVANFLPDTFRAREVGTTGNDLITGNSLPGPNLWTWLSGHFSAPENEILAGAGGADTLHAHGGHDTLAGGEGADRMEGGAGNDVYFVDHKQDRVIEAADAGLDQVFAALSVTLAAQVEQLTLTEGAGAATGVGNALGNTVVGNSFDNRLAGREGNDALSGGAGHDTLHGEAGQDGLDGGAGDDLLDGGDGHDGLKGGLGKDLLRGGAGNDTLSIEAGQAATLIGGDGDDWVMTNTWNPDTGIGNLLIGGAGNDLYYIRGDDRVVERAGDGADTITAFGSREAYVLPAHFEALEMSGDGSVAIGNAADNMVKGGYGNERLEGREGADTLYGLNGADTLLGGAGADVFRVGSGADVVLDFIPGQDRVLFEASVYLLTFATIMAGSTQTEAGALLKVGYWGDAGSALLAGVLLADLTSADFILG